MRRKAYASRHAGKDTPNQPWGRQAYRSAWTVGWRIGYRKPSSISVSHAARNARLPYHPFPDRSCGDAEPRMPGRRDRKSAPVGNRNAMCGRGKSHAAHKGPQDPLSSVKSYRFQVVKAQEKQVYQAHQEVYFPANRCRRYLHSILPDDAPESLEPKHLPHTWTYGLRCKSPSRVPAPTNLLYL